MDLNKTKDLNWSIGFERLEIIKSPIRILILAILGKEEETISEIHKKLKIRFDCDYTSVHKQVMLLEKKGYLITKKIINGESGRPVMVKKIKDLCDNPKIFYDIYKHGTKKN